MGYRIDLGVGIDSETLGRSKCGNLRDVVIFAFTLLLLELEGDTADWTTLNTPHQVGSKAADFITQTLGRDDRLSNRQFTVNDVGYVLG